MIILHSLQDDLVYSHPEETFSIEVEPRLTMSFEGLGSTMSFYKKCSTECPNFLHNFNTCILLSNYFTHQATFSMKVAHCYNIAKKAARAIIGF